MAGSTDIKVLIVDDTKLGRLSVKKTLSRLGIENSLEADTSSKVLDMIKSESPDLVLMDILMPDQDGMTTLAQIREAGLTLPVLMVTADIQDATRTRSMEAGANGFISKPIKEEKLLPLLQELGLQ